jgi:hypothetical protein
VKSAFSSKGHELNSDALTDSSVAAHLESLRATIGG